MPRKKQDASKKAEAFQKFLLKGRTEKEIISKFGDLDLLKEKFDGLNLFTQRNNYHELLHILLPVPPKGIRLLPKKYEYHIGKDDKGHEQPYLLVKIPATRQGVPAIAATIAAGINVNVTLLFGLDLIQLSGEETSKEVAPFAGRAMMSVPPTRAPRMQWLAVSTL